MHLINTDKICLRCIVMSWNEHRSSVDKWHSSCAFIQLRIEMHQKIQKIGYTVVSSLHNVSMKTYIPIVSQVTQSLHTFLGRHVETILLLNLIPPHFASCRWLKTPSKSASFLGRRILRTSRCPYPSVRFPRRGFSKGIFIANPGITAETMTNSLQARRRLCIDLLISFRVRHFLFGKWELLFMLCYDVDAELDLEGI